jgi:hypothetical protein
MTRRNQKKLRKQRKTIGIFFWNILLGLVVILNLFQMGINFVILKQLGIVMGGRETETIIFDPNPVQEVAVLKEATATAEAVFSDSLFSNEQIAGITLMCFCLALGALLVLTRPVRPGSGPGPGREGQVVDVKSEINQINDSLVIDPISDHSGLTLEGIVVTFDKIEAVASSIL